MKNATRVIAMAALVAVFAAAGYFVWSNFFGTALDNRIKIGNAAAKSARAATGRIESAIRKADSLPSVWAGLPFDETAEAKRILEDAGSNRGYKVDVLRDASASKIQKDIIAVETELNSAISDAQKAIKTMDGVSWYLPASRLADYLAAEEEANRALKLGKELAINLQELKYDVDIWGFLSISLRINGTIMASFDRVSANLAAGEYAAASTGALDLLVGVNESVTWLTHGKQELTNISVYSKDSDSILAFISDAKTTAEIFNNAAAAGDRGEIEQANTTRELAEQKLTALKNTASEQSTGIDFMTWFLANAERRLKASKPGSP